MTTRERIPSIGFDRPEEAAGPATDSAATDEKLSFGEAETRSGGGQQQISQPGDDEPDGDQSDESLERQRIATPQCDGNRHWHEIETNVGQIGDGGEPPGPA